MTFVQRVQAILLDPRSAWPAIATEPATVQSIYTNWVMVLAAIGPVVMIVISPLMGGIGFGLLGDIIIGILGAVFGGWLFTQMGWGSPFAGLAGAIFVAFIGAMVLLLIVRLLRGARRAP
jgi:uncharacterized membrane protein YeaQ/YmgE (transglycosylase-associated protein family)